MPLGIMTVHTSYGIGFLIDFGKVTEHIFSIFSFNSQIEFHAVNSSKTKQSQFVVAVKTGFNFKGSIGIGRKERQTQDFKQCLQIRPAYRHQIRSLVANMSVGTE